MSSKDKNISLLYISLILGLVLMGLKFAAWWMSNSNAILTDALESIINIVAGAFALYSIRLALKPKDQDHPYGHGKIEFISAGFEGALILIAGLVIIIKSIWDLFHVHEVEHIQIGIYITAISGIINYLLGVFLVRKGLKEKSIAIEASGKHLKSDAYSSIGLIIGLIIVYFTQNPIIDNILAIIFGIVIIVTGYQLVRRSIAGIMDEADDKLIQQFAKEINQKRRKDWIDLHNVRMIKYGANLHLDCHLTLPWYYNTQKSHSVMKDFESQVKELSDLPVELFVHVDPCEPLSCPICQVENCPKREADFKEKIDWSFKNITHDLRHHIKE